MPNTLESSVYEQLISLLDDGGDIRPTDDDFIAGIAANIDANPGLVAPICAAFDQEWSRSRFDYDYAQPFGDFERNAAAIADTYATRGEFEIIAIGYTADQPDTIEIADLDFIADNAESSADWYEWLRNATDVESVSFTARNTVFPENTDAIVYLLAPKAGIADLVSSAHEEFDSYTLACTYMGETQETQCKASDFENSMLYSESGDTLGKCDGNEMVDCAGSFETDPRNWYAGQATELHVGPWRYNDTMDCVTWCNELCARAGLAALVGDTWDEYFDFDGPNAPQLAALDSADWECTKN
jgi:hypothetical protein